jgi:hypothetical protein
MTLVYTKTDKWLISKEEVSWEVWQDKLFWYMSSISFNNIVDLADFLREDFHLDEQKKGFIIDKVMASNKTIFELYINADRTVVIIPLELELLNLKGEIIDWLDWAYVFTKNNNQFRLWVYLGGIAEQVREIILSNQQVSFWREKDNEYIRQLASELQRKDSLSYLESINENRKIL